MYVHVDMHACFYVCHSMLRVYVCMYVFTCVSSECAREREYATVCMHMRMQVYMLTERSAQL
jgi:hypothetical protein